MKRTVENTDLADLIARIATIEADARAPLAEGESRPIRPVSESFTDADWMTLTRLARAVGRKNRSTLNRFLGELGLARAIVHAIAVPLSWPRKADHRPPANVDELVARIDASVENGRWLVVIPVASLSTRAPLVELDGDCYLVAANESPAEPAWGDADAGRTELRRRLGEKVNVRRRWMRTSAHPHPIDTRLGAGLVLAVEGAEAVVTQVAQAQAAYLLAGWTLFDPPGYVRRWPRAGPWAPQPFVRFPICVTPFQRPPDDPAHTRSRTGAIQLYSEYELTDDVALLRRPVRAIRAAENRHSARALLSATWAWQQAARDASGLEITDTMFYAYTSVAALCEHPSRASDRVMLDRWEALQRNVPGLMQRAEEAGLDEAAIAAARQTLQNVRNLAAHASDAVLVNLGYPSDRARSFRRGVVPGLELGIASLQAALRPSLWLIREALLHCWTVACDTDFADDEFESLFTAQS